MEPPFHFFWGLFFDRAPFFRPSRQSAIEFCGDSPQTMVWPCNIPGQPEASSKYLSLLLAIFPGKQFTVMSPLEAEITKYAHNVFGAYKVTYFNAAREYCQQMGADWAKVHTGVLLSGYINDMHTYVPGPDGKYGYGGKCFPKDVNAFAKLTVDQPLGTLLAPLHELNALFCGAVFKTSGVALAGQR